MTRAPAAADATEGGGAPAGAGSFGIRRDAARADRRTHASRRSAAALSGGRAGSPAVAAPRWSASPVGPSTGPLCPCRLLPRTRREPGRRGRARGRRVRRSGRYPSTDGRLDRRVPIPPWRGSGGSRGRRHRPHLTGSLRRPTSPADVPRRARRAKYRTTFRSGDKSGRRPLTRAPSPPSGTPPARRWPAHAPPWERRWSRSPAGRRRARRP